MPQLVAAVEHVHAALLARSKKLKGCLVDATAAHLTLSVMAIELDDLERAKAALAAVPAILQASDEAAGLPRTPFQLSLRGLGNFRGRVRAAVQTHVCLPTDVADTLMCDVNGSDVTNMGFLECMLLDCLCVCSRQSTPRLPLAHSRASCMLGQGRSPKGLHIGSHLMPAGAIHGRAGRPGR